jgi:hypothetical protein
MKALSSYWAGDTHRAMLGASSVEGRLAIALTPVRSIIRVIDDSQPPMTVDWAQVGSDDKGKPMSLSYTDFRGSRIAVNPLPIIENKLSPERQIDICTGFAMHEASHAKHSRDRFRYLLREEPDRIMTQQRGHPVTREVPVFEPMRIAAWLWNIVEDVRIEDATTRDWRGFGPYFAALLDWMWGEQSAQIEAHRFLYGPDLNAKLRLIFVACRFPERARQMAHAESILTDAVPATEVEWWHAWQQDYLSDRVDTPTTIQRGLDHLAEDKTTLAEMEKETKQERKERTAGEKLRAQIDRLIREGAGGITICVTETGEHTVLTRDQAESVDALVKQGLQTVSPIIKHRGALAPDIRVRKPQETAGSRRAYIGRPDAATEALRAALVFRSEDPRYEVKLQRSGEIDDEELYRHGMGDERVFTQRVVESRPDTLLGLLVDMSGSMRGGISDDSRKSKLQVAQRLAQLFLWATHDMEGVTTEVWGHTGDTDLGIGSDIFRLWESGDPMSRLGLISDIDNGDNYDGYAEAYCVNQMRDREQPQKVLILLSDGYPAGHGYGGREAQQHMRQVSQWASGQGVQVIQIAIDESLRPADQAAMFGEGNWVPYVNEQQLPRDLTRILGRFAK